MPPLAFSIVEALTVLGLGAAGFLVVAMVCAIVLGVLQLVLPSTDTGAADLDRLHPPEERQGDGASELGATDTGGNT